MMELATFVLVGVAFFGALTFALSYFVVGNWRSGPVGRWLLWFSLMIMFVLSLGFLLRLGVPMNVIAWLRLATYGFTAVVIWRQVYLFWKAAPARERAETERRRVMEED